MRIERFPYCPIDVRGTDGIPAATGCYLNFLQFAGSVFLPQFGLADDQEAVRRCVTLFSDHTVYPLPCLELSLKGGLLNCITWEIEEVVMTKNELQTAIAPLDSSKKLSS